MFNFTCEQLDYYANQVKDALFVELLQCGVLTNEQSAELGRTKIVVNKKRNFISQLIRKLNKEENNKLSIMIATIRDIDKEVEELLK